MATSSQNRHQHENGGSEGRTQNVRSVRAANDDSYTENVVSINLARNRGIQNVRPVNSHALSLHEPETIPGRFKEKKGLQAQVYKKAAANQKLDAAVQKREWRGTGRETDSAGRSSSSSLERISIRLFGVVIPGLWIQLSVAFIVFIWQFWFSLFALLGFFSEATVAYFQNHTLPGRFIGLFVDLTKYFPGDYVGYFCLFVLLMFALGTFFVLGVLYPLKGRYPLGNTPAVLITVGCFIFSIFPPMSLLPWNMAWVVYMNTLAPRKK